MESDELNKAVLNDRSHQKSEHSLVAKFSYIVAILIFVIGFCNGVFIGNSNNTSLSYNESRYLEICNYVMIGVWVSSLIMGSLFVIGGKVVDLLTDIRNNR